MQVGDRVELSGGETNPQWGTVVCVISPPQFTAEYPESQWSYLKTGVMVFLDDGTLIHYPDGVVEPPIGNLDGVTWAVWREDDNGIRTRMQAGLTESDARRIVVEFTRRGHKQRYWPEKDGT